MEDVRTARSPGPREPIGDPLPGQLVDRRYRVGRLVAVGGMARVYRARDERLDRLVALKIINADLVTSPEFVAAFQREARLVARLSHPHVVTVFDQDSHAGLPFVVMEFVPGRSLRDILNAQGRLPVSQALRLCRQVLSALSAAHRIGLIHRDIKPENVLVSTSEAEQVVKVADFGLAQAVQAGGWVRRPGPLLATVAYLPPELLTTGRADPRSDVYSTGILLYELLTGEVPFDDPDPLEVAHMHLERDTPSVVGVCPDIPAEVAALVRRATRRDPRSRPVDAAAFAMALDCVDERLATGSRRWLRRLWPPGR